MKLSFTAIIKIRGINPYIDVTSEQAALLQPNWRKPMPVLIQIKGSPDKSWRINMMPAGNGSFYLYLHEKIRKASGTGVGDPVIISLEFDTEYKNGPQHPAPKWFTDALENNVQAKKNWKNLPPSRQKEILRHFASLKSDEAKNRNLEKAIYVLSGHPGRFMARSWENGS